MTSDDFVTYLSSLGLTVEVISGVDNKQYVVVRDFELPKGALSGRHCDIAIQRIETVPFMPPPSIHTRPQLVPMNSSDPLRTMSSGIGTDWQYWSRRLDHRPTPKVLWTHILTVLCDDRWPTS